MPLYAVCDSCGKSFDLRLDHNEAGEATIAGGAHVWLHDDGEIIACSDACAILIDGRIAAKRPPVAEDGQAE